MIKGGSSNSARFYAKHKIQSTKSKKGAHQKCVSKCTINDLPSELILKIFTSLDVNSLLSATCACQRWKLIASDQLLWEKFFQYYFDSGGSSPYVRLKRLSKQHESSSCTAENKPLLWKKEFFSQCRSTNRKIFSKLKKNSYTGVTDNTSAILLRYAVKFQLCITDAKGSKCHFLSDRWWSSNTSTALQWNSLNSFPAMDSIVKMEIVSITPLVFGKDKKPFPFSPTQSGLIKCEEFEKHSREKSFKILGHDCKSHLTLKSTIGGFIIAVWDESQEIAFVCCSLHHHDLILKCFFSSPDSIYSFPHSPILDDIDNRYGLHGYQCYLCIHTLKKTVWENKFSYLLSRQSAGNGMVSMQPDTYTMNRFHYSHLEWKTELFSGRIDDVAFFNVTVIDCNNEIIWSGSYPVAAQSVMSMDVSFENNGPLTMFECHDKPGTVSVIFSKKNRSYLPQVLINISTSLINEWFGKNH